MRAGYYETASHQLSHQMEGRWESSEAGPRAHARAAKDLISWTEGMTYSPSRA